MAEKKEAVDWILLGLAVMLALDVAAFSLYLITSLFGAC